MSRGLNVGLLGKLACLPSLDSEKMAHMESITFHYKQHKICTFSDVLLQDVQAKPQTSPRILETGREITQPTSSVLRAAMKRRK